MENFLGKDGFNWFMGVVESRDDPLNLGRCRVRIFGMHTDNKQEIPTDSLSWALPGFSPNSSWMSSTPIVGDFVFGFFTDGSSGQAPVMLAVFPGIPANGANEQKGFSEGTHYPVGEPTTSRLYRNEKIDQTPIGYHNNDLDTGVATASGGSWSEPKSQYNTKPPYNRVTETESGHVFEMDDTPGAERIHLNHMKNTFFEIAPDGSKVTKVSGKNYEIYLSDNNVHIKGACNITVDGNANLYVKGNVIEKIDGTFTGTASSWNLTGDVTVNDISKGAGLRLDSAIFTDPTTQGTKDWSVINYIGTATVETTNTGVVLTNAATFLIEGAPGAGVSGNVSITNPWAVYVRKGNTFLGGTSVNKPGADARINKGRGPTKGNQQ